MSFCIPYIYIYREREKEFYRYDWQFILNYLISKTKATPTVVTAGTKIIFIQHKNVKLLDSYKYLTMSLAAIGKAFNIPVQKG